MRRFFVDKTEPHVTLRDDDHIHLTRVLRARSGDSVILCNNRDGKDYRYEIVQISKNDTGLSLQDSFRNETELPKDLLLFPAMIKPQKMELIIQKAAELGAKGLQPLVTQYSQFKKESFSMSRAEKISAEASKQCGRAFCMQIKSPVDFTDFLRSVLPDFDLVIFLYEKADTGLQRVLRQTDWNSIHRIALIIGPEGGFAETEVCSLKNLGIKPISMGKAILRAETASIAALSILTYEMGGSY